MHYGLGLILKNDSLNKIDKKTFKVKNDTLFIPENYEIFAYGNKLKTVIGKFSLRIEINHHVLDSLVLKTEGGYVQFNNANLGSQIKNLKIQAKNTTFSWAYPMKIETLQVTSDNSKFEVGESTIDKIDVNAKNKTEFLCYKKLKLKELVYRDDSTSQIITKLNAFEN